MELPDIKKMIFICQQSKFDTEQRRHTKTPIVPRQWSASPKHAITIILGKHEWPDPPMENLKALHFIYQHICIKLRALSNNFC